VNQILPRIQRKWLASDERGHLVVARLDLDEPLVRHFSKKLDEPQRAAGILRILLSRDNEGAHVFTLGRLLDWADERIAEVEGRSNEAKEKQT
jgi:hypothetical protein